MTSRFWSIEDILAENQKLPCTFKLDVPNLGHLEGTDERDIRQGTTIELPFWLGLELARMVEHDLVSISLPKPYTSRVRNALVASAQSVSLRSLTAGSFYQVGLKLEDTITDPKLKSTLHNAFKARLPEIFDQSQHGGGRLDAGNDFVAGMDDWEKEIFTAGEKSARSMKAWIDPRYKPGSRS